MPIVSTELTEAEFAKLKADQTTMGAPNLGLVMKAALTAFSPKAAAPAAGEDHQGAPTPAPVAGAGGEPAATAAGAEHPAGAEEAHH